MTHPEGRKTVSKAQKEQIESKYSKIESVKGV
jgi:hypothetical protein